MNLSVIRGDPVTMTGLVGHNLFFTVGLTTKNPKWSLTQPQNGHKMNFQAGIHCSRLSLRFNHCEPLPVVVGQTWGMIGIKKINKSWNNQIYLASIIWIFKYNKQKRCRV